MPSKSRIVAEVDFDKNGRQQGFLRLFHSVHSSAYGFIPIPIVVLKNGDGPTALLVSGTHGDEYEGQVALCNLVKSLDPARIHGRVIILPAANYPGCDGRSTHLADRRGQPEPAVPGRCGRDGHEQIAYHIEHELVPMADSGVRPALRRFVADVCAVGVVWRLAARRQHRTRRRGAEGVRLAGRVCRGDGAGRRPHAVGRCGAAGHHCLGTEAGGSGHVTRAALRMVERGVNNVLVHQGILPDSARIVPDGPTRFFEVGGPDYFVYAPESGLFEPLVELGEMVRAGQPAARMHWPETPWAEPVTAQFRARWVRAVQADAGADDAGGLSVPSGNRR